MAAGIEKRPENERKLLTGGIATRDEEQKLLPMLDILDQIHSKWQVWDKDQKNQAGLALFGQRYLSDFLALMANYDEARKKVKDFANDHGEAAKAIEAQMASIQKQWDRIGPSIQQAITKAIIPSEQAASAWAAFFGAIADQFGKAQNGVSGLGFNVGTQAVSNYRSIEIQRQNDISSARWQGLGNQ